MKKLFVFITLSIFNLTQIFGQSGWRADLRVYNESYIQETEVNVNMVVDLYYDDVLVLPQSNYKYEFFYRYVSTEWIKFVPRLSRSHRDRGYFIILEYGFKR